MTYNWLKFYTQTFRWLTIFRFPALCTYLLDNNKFCFHLSLIFWLLPSKIGTVEKIKTLQKRSRAIQTQVRRSKLNMAWNSIIHGVTNSNSFRNARKVRVLLAKEPSKELANEAMWVCVCRSDFTVAHGAEEYINRHKNTASLRNMLILHKNKEN